MGIRVCEKCGTSLRRVQRTLWERILYRSAYKCPKCEFRHLRLRTLLRGVRATARCPRCSSSRLKILKKRDKLEFMEKSLLRMAQGFLGAHLYYCSRCRVQFYDMRRYRASKSLLGVENSPAMEDQRPPGTVAQTPSSEADKAS